MNKDIFQGKLKEISGELRKKWGALTDDDIEQTKGNLESLSGLVQQKAGLSREEAEKQVSQFLAEMDKKYESAGSSVTAKFNEKVDKIKNKLSH
ncbi:CsbD family protein [Bdellovibrio sp. 22V]|uniref:CsbD family protein n=1 Tax=Bdellovibrio TaxID=958 RepID=UPI002542D347|nr:CsbD family protein [Bdellovibrio sp. 22V]WII73121.1 CsbD family protein [Bdellovibrio sp. 22V]